MLSLIYFVTALLWLASSILYFLSYKKSKRKVELGLMITGIGLFLLNATQTFLHL